MLYTKKGGLNHGEKYIYSNGEVQRNLAVYKLKSSNIGEYEGKHIRVFHNDKKLFDYYPCRMKLFDYHSWHQLSYPMHGNKDWEKELRTIIEKLIRK